MCEGMWQGPGHPCPFTIPQRADLTTRRPGGCTSQAASPAPSPAPTETSQCLSTVTRVSFAAGGSSQQRLPPPESGDWW